MYVFVRSFIIRMNVYVRRFIIRMYVYVRSFIIRMNLYVRRFIIRPFETPLLGALVLFCYLQRIQPGDNSEAWYSGQLGLEPADRRLGRVRREGQHHVAVLLAMRE